MRYRFRVPEVKNDHDEEVPMKYRSIPIKIVLLISTVTLLASCDAMFTTNMFAKLTHKTPSTDTVAAMSPAELQKFISSPINMAMLEDDPALKAAALTNLRNVYTSGTADAATRQQAAIVSADISIQTVPAAAAIANNLLSTAATNFDKISTATPASFASLMQDVLPASVGSALSSGQATPPAEFTQIIGAFQEANAAYAALDTAIPGDAATYASLPASQTATIAVNCVLSGLVSAVTPTTGASVADALWTGMAEAQSGAPTVTAFIIPSTTFDDVTASNVVADSSLSTLFTSGGTK
jgi:hypothetical protein